MNDEELFEKLKERYELTRYALLYELKKFFQGDHTLFEMFGFEEDRSSEENEFIEALGMFLYSIRNRKSLSKFYLKEGAKNNFNDIVELEEIFLTDDTFVCLAKTSEGKAIIQEMPTSDFMQFFVAEDSPYIRIFTKD